MINLSRRKLIVSGLVATAGASGMAVAARLAQKYGLVPPDHGGIYGLGETLTYASQRLLTRHSLAREFPRSRISPRPFPNELAPFMEDFKRLRAGGFADCRLSVDGMVAQPASFSIADLKSYPSRSHITELACEEGWSYIAEWIGVPLSHVLNLVGVLPQARYVVYVSMEPDTWDSIDASRLQEHKVHHPPDGHRQSEKVWQRPRLRRCRGRLRLVHRHLIRRGLSKFNET